MVNIQALVRVFNNNGDTRKVVGGGFFVSDCHIITCAHVIDGIEGIADESLVETKTVWVDLPLVKGSKLVATKIVRLYPANRSSKVEYGELEDIVVLKLNSSEDIQGIHPVSLVDLEPNSCSDREVRVFGFPHSMDTGVWLECKTQGPNARGWIQVDRKSDCGTVSEGFSGSPLFSKCDDTVIGMIVAVHPRHEGLAYLIPVRTLKQAWPDLAVQVCAHRGSESCKKYLLIYHEKERAQAIELHEKIKERLDLKLASRGLSLEMMDWQSIVTIGEGRERERRGFLSSASFILVCATPTLLAEWIKSSYQSYKQYAIQSNLVFLQLREYDSGLAANFPLYNENAIFCVNGKTPWSAQAGHRKDEWVDEAVKVILEKLGSNKDRT